jgi:hypothetical protein
MDYGVALDIEGAKASLRANGEWSKIVAVPEETRILMFGEP